MLEDANKRLIEMQESQLEVNKALLAYLAKQDEKTQAPDMNPSEMLEKLVQERVNLGVSQVSQDMGQVGHHSPRPKTAAEKVKDYLSQNPSARYEPVRDLAEKIGVGKSTVSRVINEDL